MPYHNHESLDDNYCIKHAETGKYLCCNDLEDSGFEYEKVMAKVQLFVSDVARHQLIMTSLFAKTSNQAIIGISMIYERL